MIFSSKMWASMCAFFFFSALIHLCWAKKSMKKFYNYCTKVHVRLAVIIVLRTAVSMIVFIHWLIQLSTAEYRGEMVKPYKNNSRYKKAHAAHSLQIQYNSSLKNYFKFVLYFKNVLYPFSAPAVPACYKTVIFHGFVEELVVNDDPEYQVL